MQTQTQTYQTTKVGGGTTGFVTAIDTYTYNECSNHQVFNHDALDHDLALMGSTYQLQKEAMQ
jgi:hypothetical protein